MYFFYALFTSITLFAVYDPILEHLIQDMDLEGVQVLIKQSQLTHQERIKLLEIAHSMVVKYKKEYEVIDRQPDSSTLKEGISCAITVLGGLGMVSSPIYFTIGNYGDRQILPGVLSSLLSASLFVPGFWSITCDRKNSDKHIEELKKKHLQKIATAQAIRRLVLVVN